MDDRYNVETREAYRSTSKAASYDARLRSFTWMRFAMWREKLAVQKALRLCKLDDRAKVLDLPCGTGILADIFSQERYAVVSSDISLEMIELARPHYTGGPGSAFVNADALALPFRAGTFDCVVSIGFFHRLPPGIRRRALASLGTVSQGRLIASFSLDGPGRRFKIAILRLLWRRYSSAPSVVSLPELTAELANAGWCIARRWAVAPLLSSESVMLLERSSATS